MKVIVGLGNPGKKYEKTRHNIGFLFLDFLQKKYDFSDFSISTKFKALIAKGVVAGNEVLLVKPQTFMNLSGETVLLIKQFYKFANSDFLICLDDVDLPFKTVRFKKAGSAGTHNGLRSILGTLSDEGVPRLRFGIEDKERLMDLSSFVLSSFSDDEFLSLSEVFENSLAKLLDLA